MRRFWLYVKENSILFLLGAPAVLFIIAFNYIPMFGTVIAFQDYSPRTMFFSPWVGFRNFRLLLETPLAGASVTNTVGLNFMFITATTFFSVTVASAAQRSSSCHVQAGGPIRHVPAVLYGLDDCRHGAVSV